MSAVQKRPVPATMKGWARTASMCGRRRRGGFRLRFFPRRDGKSRAHSLRKGSAHVGTEQPSTARGAAVISASRDHPAPWPRPVAPDGPAERSPWGRRRASAPAPACRHVCPSSCCGRARIEAGTGEVVRGPVEARPMSAALVVLRRKAAFCEHAECCRHVARLAAMGGAHEGDFLEAEAEAVGHPLLECRHGLKGLDGRAR